MDSVSPRQAGAEGSENEKGEGKGEMNERQCLKCGKTFKAKGQSRICVACRMKAAAKAAPLEAR